MHDYEARDLKLQAFSSNSLDRSLSVSADLLPDTFIVANNKKWRKFKMNNSAERLCKAILKLDKTFGDHCENFNNVLVQKNTLGILLYCLYQHPRFKTFFLECMQCHIVDQVFDRMNFQTCSELSCSLVLRNAAPVLKRRSSIAHDDDFSYESEPQDTCSHPINANTRFTARDVAEKHNKSSGKPASTLKATSGDKFLSVIRHV